MPLGDLIPTGREEPQILNARPLEAVIKIDDVAPLRVPEDIPDVTIAVDSLGLSIPKPWLTRANYAFRHTKVMSLNRLRHKLVVFEVREIRMTVRVGRELHAVMKRAAGADVVEPRQETSDLHQFGIRHLIEDPPADFGEDRVEDPGIRDLTEGAAVWKLKGNDYRDLNSVALLEKLVLLLNLLSRPPTRAIEFDDPIGVPPSRVGLKIDIELNFVDTVLKTVERENTTGTSHTERLHRLKHPLGRELKEELGR